MKKGFETEAEPVSQSLQDIARSPRRQGGQSLQVGEEKGRELQRYAEDPSK